MDGDRRKLRAGFLVKKPRGRDQQDSPTEFAASSESKSSAPSKPIILAKPSRQSQVVAENDEEWPTVGSSSAVSTPSTMRKTVLSSTNNARSTAVVGRSHVSSSNDQEKTGHFQEKEMFQPAMTVLKPWLLKKEGSAASGTSVASRSHPSAVSSDVSQSATEIKQLSSAIKLVNEYFEWTDVQQYLSESGTDFLVVGVLGPVGCGKSTFMSMLSGNTGHDMYRTYTFRPSSREAIETGAHQTCGIQFYVTEERMILLDVQPIVSASVLDYLIEKKYNVDYMVPENAETLQSLQLATFLMQVCNVVVVLVDWFIDPNIAKFIRTAEMLKPFPLSTTDSAIYDYMPHLVFVQNRASRSEFVPLSIRNKCRILETLFADTQLQCKDSISMCTSLLSLHSEAVASDFNFFMLPDLPSIKQKSLKTGRNDEIHGFLEYDMLMRILRNQILSISRTPFVHSQTQMNEKAWLAYANKTWDSIMNSLLLSEFGRL